MSLLLLMVCRRNTTFYELFHCFYQEGAGYRQPPVIYIVSANDKVLKMDSLLTATSLLHS
jgi:hypothetical protein